MNDLMSFGLHRVWKDILVAKVRPSLTRPFSHIDVAGGTGELSEAERELARALGARVAALASRLASRP